MGIEKEIDALREELAKDLSASIATVLYKVNSLPHPLYQEIKEEMRKVMTSAELNEKLSILFKEKGIEEDEKRLEEIEKVFADATLAVMDKAREEVDKLRGVTDD